MMRRFVFEGWFEIDTLADGWTVEESLRDVLETWADSGEVTMWLPKPVPPPPSARPWGRSGWWKGLTDTEWEAFAEGAGFPAAPDPKRPNPGRPSEKGDPPGIGVIDVNTDPHIQARPGLLTFTDLQEFMDRFRRRSEKGSSRSPSPATDPEGWRAWAMQHGWRGRRSEERDW